MRRILGKVKGGADGGREDEDGKNSSDNEDHNKLVLLSCQAR